MLKGTMASYMAGVMDGEDPQEDPTPLGSEHTFPGADKDEMPVDSIHDEETLSIVTLLVKAGASVNDYDPIQCPHY